MNNSKQYDPAIKSVLKKLNPNLSINKKSLQLLNGILNQINDKLVSHCREALKETGYSQEKNDQIAAAYNAVETIFPAELKNNAKAECHRSITLFHTGLLDHNVRDSLTKTGALKAGIRYLGSAICPDAKLEQTSLLIINDILDNLFAKAIERAAESGSTNNKIEASDFADALKHLLPKEMQMHAKCEGTKKIQDHESHLFTFIPGMKIGTPVKPSPRPPSKPKAPGKKVRRSEPAELPKKPINFSNGMKQITKEVNSDLRLSKTAVTLLDYIANEINYKLVDHCNRSTQHLPENSTIYVAVAEDAVKETYPGELLPHAVGEANKDVLLLQNNIIEYKPRKRKIKEVPITQKKMTQRTVLAKGLQSLTNNSVPNATLHTETRAFISNLLENLITKICRETRLNMENQNKLQYSDISSSLANVLPKEMCQCARAEAGRTLLKYEIGLVSFTPHE